MRERKYNWGLKKAIVESGLRQNFIANKISVDGAILTKYITGERIAPDEKRAMIADILNCEIDDIFKD